MTTVHLGAINHDIHQGLGKCACSSSEVACSLLNGMNRLADFIQLRKAWLTCLHSPSTMVVSHRLPKNGKQTHWTAKAASKAFCGYPRGEESSKW